MYYMSIIVLSIFILLLLLSILLFISLMGKKHWFEFSLIADNVATFLVCLLAIYFSFSEVANCILSFVHFYPGFVFFPAIWRCSLNIRNVTYTKRIFTKCVHGLFEWYTYFSKFKGCLLFIGVIEWNAMRAKKKKIHR